MTAEQFKGYGRRWQDACRAQGWKASDKEKRREIVRGLCGGRTFDELTSEGDVSKVFRYFEFLADPANLSKAIPAANPEVAVEGNTRAQFLHSLRGFGFADAYVGKIAVGLCRRAGVADWKELPFGELEKLRYTIRARANERDARNDLRPPIARRREAYHKRPEAKARRKAMAATGPVDDPNCPF